jgi:hypothetical protein
MAGGDGQRHRGARGPAVGAGSSTAPDRPRNPAAAPSGSVELDAQHPQRDAAAQVTLQLEDDA